MTKQWAIACASLIASFNVATAEYADTGDAGEPASAAEAVKQLVDGLGNAQGEVLWQAFPANYQADINHFVRSFAGQMDAEAYDEMFRLLARLEVVIAEQETFILNSKLGDQSAERKKQLAELLPRVRRLLHTLNQSELTSLEKLAEFDGATVSAGTLSLLLQDIDALAEFLGIESLSERLAKVKVQSASNTNAKDPAGNTLTTLTMTGLLSDSAQTISFTQLDGHWLPSKMVAGWQQEFKNAHGHLETMPEEMVPLMKPRIMISFRMFNGLFNNMEAASSQEKFDKSARGLLVPLRNLTKVRETFILCTLPKPAGAAPAKP
ncbi:hypothetical protein [Persicirhabdus sediminis]|uniref:Uncharacterized protein n=1 Tax=Persicirhabdus sediminis TaxID=454144 RepID=A0A8J7SME9_9BACT|nr:hypothetical protein [Persicirhabdus sediminis]MBK1792025.1 hypothetical protein [Persicirhabdus sediminis]